MMHRRPEFPGMDPWLEHPDLWPDVRNSLIASIADVLRVALRPRYFVGVESRTMLLSSDDINRQAMPDVSIRPLDLSGPVLGGAVAVAEPVDVRVAELDLPFAQEVDEWYLEVRALPSKRVVTAIEVLSPANKRSVQGRGRYLGKRMRVLESRTNLIEIDLLRAGAPMPMREDLPSDDYRIVVSRGRSRPKATYYGFGCRAAVPDVPVPLLPGEPEANLPLNRLLHELIDRARYYAVANYDAPPVPPLRPMDVEWAAALIEAAKPTPEKPR